MGGVGTLAGAGETQIEIARRLIRHRIARLKSDLATYIDSDKDMITYNMKIAYQKEKIDFLESVIKTVNIRGFHIKNAIDWEKFKVGI